METPKSQLTAEPQWQSKQTLKPTKRDNLHPKTRKKPRQDGRRDTIMIKLNLVHTGCMGYTWKIVIPRKFSHRRESSEPPCQASQPGGLATGGVAPKNLLCRPVRFDHRNFTGLEETETVLLKDAHRVSRIPRPRRKSSNLLRGWGRLSCEY